jgi:hypothetical protein
VNDNNNNNNNSNSNTSFTTSMDATYRAQLRKPTSENQQQRSRRQRRMMHGSRSERERPWTPFGVWVSFTNTTSSRSVRKSVVKLCNEWLNRGKQKLYIIYRIADGHRRDPIYFISPPHSLAKKSKKKSLRATPAGPGLVDRTIGRGFWLSNHRTDHAWRFSDIFFVEHRF